MMNLLHHKRLIALFDAFETKAEMIVIMELVTGGELFEKVVEEDNLTEKQVIRYTKQVLYGVQHMHRKHMVHLDLKVNRYSWESSFLPTQILQFIVHVSSQVW